MNDFLAVYDLPMPTRKPPSPQKDGRVHFPLRLQPKLADRIWEIAEQNHWSLTTAYELVLEAGVTKFKKTSSVAKRKLPI